MITKIYVGTYLKYNSGSLKGDYIELEGLTHDEFMEACAELHSDEEDPEFMFQDTELPKILEGFVSESSVNEKLFDAITFLTDNSIDLDDDSDVVRLHNDACEELNYDDSRIYDWTLIEDYIENMKPMDAFQLGKNSDFSWSDDYFRFDGYGNLESTSNPSQWVDEQIIIEFLEKQ